MAIHSWTLLTNGQIVAFDPLLDELVFNESAISAADVSFDFTANTSIFSFGGKTVTLQSAPDTLATTNVIFQNGSLFLFGDNSTSTAGDGLANTLTGGSHGDQLNGSAGNDTLNGGAGNDMLIGEAGNDRLNGGGGADTLIGGTGNDLYFVNAAGDTVIETLNQGTDTVRSSITYTLSDHVESLILIGAAAVDGTGNNLANTLTGNAQNNYLSGLGNSDTLNGGAGNDTLNGGGGADWLLGGEGNDTLIGNSGGDTLTGGGGNDVLIWDSADVVVDGGSGTDTLKVTGSGLVLDLTSASSIIHNIEVINITGSGDNTLMLGDGGDVIAVSGPYPGPYVLRVDGNTGDSVTTASGGWSHMLNVVIGSNTYAQYFNGVISLRVDTALERTGINTNTIEISLSSRDGDNGFRISGAGAYDNCGKSVSAAGDINGDGFGDVIVGAPNALVDGAGASYVIYGKESGFASDIQLEALSSANGFMLSGAGTYDQTGGSVSSAGDVNGDGFGDVIVGALGASPNGDSSGASYVVFGTGSGLGSNVDLSSLDGTNGFRLSGAAEFDLSGWSVSSAGDVNGDGFGDLVIGARDADPNGLSSGESYLVFGKGSGFTASLNLSALNGTNGLHFDGVAAGDQAGNSVHSAGDVNGDGYDDVIIGAPGADANGTDSGAAYVVFGQQSGFTSGINLSTLNGTTGFKISGVEAYDSTGFSVGAAGDINGDGFDDMVVGAYGARSNSQPHSGASFVVFGKADGFGAEIALSDLNGTNGFRISGTDFGDGSGLSVSGAGDFNGDGYDDLIIGAPFAQPNGPNTGMSYVVFGAADGFGANFDLSAIDGINGIFLVGATEQGYSGISVSAAGDVNGDGFDDLVVGASGANASYVVFGGDFTGAVTHLGSNVADSITGSASAEVFVSGQGNDTIRMGAGADVVHAGQGNDRILVTNTAFADIDGGSGIDTLKILGAGRTLDLTALANNEITGIERIDITGSGDNALVLSDLDVLALSDTSNQLRVDGNSGDVVDLVGTWTDAAAGATYHTWTLGAATILIGNDISVI